MAALTFGSFGDILALTTITITCVRSLSNSVGSASDFQDFIDELQSLKDDLDRVAAYLSVTMDNASPSSSATGANFSPRAIEQCHSAMEVFHINVKKYEKRLNGKGLRSWFYKMLWAIWKKDQVSDFRMKLLRHRQAITMLHLELQSAQLSRIVAVTEMPPSVKNTLANSIEFVDAVGTRVLFHIDYCSSWKKLDALLKAHFADAPFGRFVQNGEYNISYRSGKKIIRPQEWCRVVQAGMVVEMSIILKHGNLNRENICPICGYSNSDASPREGWIECLGLDCMARFQTYNDDGWNNDGESERRPNFEEREVMHIRQVHLKLTPELLFTWNMTGPEAGILRDPQGNQVFSDSFIFVPPSKGLEEPSLADDSMWTSDDNNYMRAPNSHFREKEHAYAPSHHFTLSISGR